LTHTVGYAGDGFYKSGVKGQGVIGGESEPAKVWTVMRWQQITWLILTDKSYRKIHKLNTT